MAPHSFLILAAVALAAGCGTNVPPPGAECAALVSASRTGDIPAIETALAAGVNPNACRAGGNGWTPLYHAIHKNQRRAVDALIRGGADVNQGGALPRTPARSLAGAPTPRSAPSQGAPGFTPLMMAVGNGQLQIARQLLDAGANPRAGSNQGASVLSIAVSGGALTDIENPTLGACHTDVVRELLRRDPTLRLDHNLHARFARWTAWLNGCQEVMAIIARR